MWELTGKNAIVTGANSGIGKVTAHALVELGASVTLACRNPMRGQAAVDEIEAATGRRPDLLICDFSDLDTIRRAAAQYREGHEALHLLVNNAGAYFPRRRESPQGYEMSMAVNHLGYFLFTHELRPLLEASAPARIVNVASAGHRIGRLDFDDLHFSRRPYVGFVAYGTSKLMNILFTRELARRLDGTGVTANCLHPGAIGTGFAQDEPGIFGRFMGLFGFLLSTPEQGARTSIHLATSPEVDGITGGYFARRRPARSSRTGRDMALAGRLWTASESLCEIG